MTFERLLLVDDDEVDRRAVRRALAEAGWSGQLLEASDAASALAQLEGVGLVLLDYNLPAINGLELLPHLLAAVDPPPAVVMLTGEGSEMVAVEAMKMGVCDYLPKGRLDAEAMRRLLHVAAQQRALHAERRAAREALERQALHDELTGIGNRRLFERDFAARLASVRRHGRTFALLMMDLDGFKRANDRYGHAAGDVILATFARRLKSVLRGEDACFRLGGDEFTALVEVADAQALAPCLARIREEAERLYEHEGLSIHVGVSIGAAIHPADGTDAETLIRRADEAMYAAKRESR